MCKMKTKYRSKKTTLDGIQFDSKKEAQRYAELLLLQKGGIISDLKLQVKFEIIPKQKDERAAHYIADFVYQENGKTVAEDTKGYKTKEYILKRKLFKYNYPDINFKEL